MSADAAKENEEAIFDAAIQIEDTAARAAYLSRACGSNSTLRAAIEELLRFHDTKDDLLAKPAVDLNRLQCAESAEQPGTVMGRYRIMELIAEGGFGVVYRAEQLEPVRREVALKIIKPGMDTREIIGRFEAERQALAMMSHPNIATVLDAGTTPAGRPYFVMELVAGQPLDAFCDAHRLSVPDRLDLFVQVCRAVQHAHNKGIVHRDLKPSNVLIAAGDPGAPGAVLKVIDFGIAKALHQPTSRFATADLRSLLGTPEYMSPEQVAGGSDIDTRADIYALGGMLYKLLTGVTPIDANLLTQGGFDEVCRAIREAEPMRPSARLTELGDRLHEIAQQRSAQPASLARLLRGDLDWIVMKALEKDRARRYETVNELARDVERYLDQQPVSAGPPSRWYVASKFIRRNRIVVAAAGTVIGAVAVGAVLAAVGFLHAERQRQHAEREWSRAERERASAEGARQRAVEAGQEAEQARKAAQREQQNAMAAAEKAQRTASLLEQLLGAASPEHGRPADYPVRKLLDDFAESMANQLEGQPEIEASVRRTIGRSYLSLGDQARAGPQLARALELRQQTLGEEHALTAQSRVDYAIYLVHVPRLDEAEGTAQRAIDTLAKLEPSPELAAAYQTLARSHFEYGDREAEERFARQALSLFEQLRGRDHRDTIMAQARLAALHLHKGSTDQAETMARDALDRLRKLLPAEHTDVAQLETLLSSILRERSVFDESERLARHAIAAHRKSLGPDSYAEAMALVNLARLLHRTSRTDEAESAARDALRIAQQATIGRLTLRATAHETLASVLRRSKQAESAEHLAKAIELRRQAIGDRPQIVQLLHRRVDVLEHLGRFDEAIECLRDVVANCMTRPDERMPLARGYLRLAEALHEAGRAGEAREALHEASTVLAGADALPLNRYVLVDALVDLGEVPYAEAEVEKLERLVEGSTQPLARGMSLAARARLLASQGHLAEAERLLRDAAGILKWPEHFRGRMLTSIALARCLIQAGRLDEAERLLLNLERRRERNRLPAEDTRRILKLLVELYSAWNKPQQAAHWRDQLPGISDE